MRRRYGAALPFLIMTSSATHDETVAYFREHKFFGLPQAEARRQILARALARQSPSDELLDRAVAETDGLSGAQLQEVAIVAVQQAIFRGDVDPTGIARVSLDDLVAAADRLGSGRRKPIGFGG